MVDHKNPRVERKRCCNLTETQLGCSIFFGLINSDICNPLCYLLMNLQLLHYSLRCALNFTRDHLLQAFLNHSLRCALIPPESLPSDNYRLFCTTLFEPDSFSRVPSSFNKGLATFTLNTSINGPMKNAVIIVPTPAIVGT